jgi:signal transduction histidine kinase
LLETGLTATQRKYAETVQRSGKNLLDIINDILDFSKIEAGKLELENVDMDLRRTVEDVVDLLAERAHSKGLELACSIPADLATHVRGDPLRLGQVLTNLVGNAIKFTRQGAVVIRVASTDETAGQDHHALRGERYRRRASAPRRSRASSTSSRRPTARPRASMAARA